MHASECNARQLRTRGPTKLSPKLGKPRLDLDQPSAFIARSEVWVYSNPALNPESTTAMSLMLFAAELLCSQKLQGNGRLIKIRRWACSSFRMASVRQRYLEAWRCFAVQHTTVAHDSDPREPSLQLDYLLYCACWLHSHFCM